jgi:hypothetical protein
MGYTTDFEGQFNLDKPLTAEHSAYLTAFAQTRRMQRNPELTAKMPDPVREAVGLPLGEQGEYFVGGTGMMGQDRTPDVTNDRPPMDQPFLWCQWTPTEDGTAIEWDGGEKFYSYIEWIQYLIQHFLAPWGYILNGTVEWQGEDRGDSGRIVITDNKVTTQTGKVVYS